MKTFMIAVLILTVVLHVVHGFRTGAPNAACDGVSPNPGATGHNAQPQTSASPFTLTIYGSPTYYVPECQYWLTLDRNGDETFRGFLTLARDMSNSRVGSFTAGTDQQQTCSPTGQGMNGITHTNANEKMYVSLNWTAPAAGTGPITFRYAGVVMRMNYWADQMGPMLNESNSTTCPDFPSTAPTPASSSRSNLSATFMTVVVLVVVLLAMMM